MTELTMYDVLGRMVVCGVLIAAVCYGTCFLVDLVNAVKTQKRHTDEIRILGSEMQYVMLWVKDVADKKETRCKK